MEQQELTVRFLKDYEVQDSARSQYKEGQEVTFILPSAMHFINANLAEEVTGLVKNPVPVRPEGDLTDKADARRTKKGGKTFSEAQGEYREQQMVEPSSGPNVFGSTSDIHGA